MTPEEKYIFIGKFLQTGHFKNLVKETKDALAKHKLDIDEYNEHTWDFDKCEPIEENQIKEIEDSFTNLHTGILDFIKTIVSSKQPKPNHLSPAQHIASELTEAYTTGTPYASTKNLILIYLAK